MRDYSEDPHGFLETLGTLRIGKNKDEPYSQEEVLSLISLKKREGIIESIKRRVEDNLKLSMTLLSAIGSLVQLYGYLIDLLTK